MKLDVKIPFRDIEKIECYVPGARTTAQAVQAGNGADLVINTAIFDMASGEILSRVVADGKTYGKWSDPAWGIGFPHGKPPAKTWDNGQACQHYLGPYSYAVVDGQVRDGLKDRANRGRMLVGLTDDALVVLGFNDVDASRCSTARAAQAMLERGCTFAINQDGGASVQWAGAFGSCKGGRSVPAFLCIWLKKADKSPEDKPTVCLDAGHGIETAGKRSPDGTYLEHEFALDVAQRIKAHLERCGAKVMMTRSDAHDVSLTERCRIANASGADVFVSIHSNAAGDNGWYSAQGWSAHIVGRGGQAEAMAGAIRAQSIPMLGCTDRGVQVNNYQVLRDTAMPAVLIEHGFHTHKDEVERLKSDAYRALCAESDARGIAVHLGLQWDAEALQYDNTEDNEMVHATATRRQPVYTEAGLVDGGRYITTGDRCTVGPITKSLLIKVEYPVSGGTRKAYIKSLEGFRV